jgi:hypothetical protein
MSCNKVEDDAVAREEEAEIRNEASEKVAANALTALGSSARKEEEDDDDDEMDFEIPQRFTKSGRKRAVPFSLKVSSVWLQLSVRLWLVLWLQIFVVNLQLI